MQIQGDFTLLCNFYRRYKEFGFLKECHYKECRYKEGPQFKKRNQHQFPSITYTINSDTINGGT